MSARFSIFKAFPTDRDDPVVELWMEETPGVTEIPMLVRREAGELRVVIYTRDGSPGWDYPLQDVLEGLNRAVEALD